MTNIYGPGHYPTTSEVTTRPSPIPTGSDVDTWFGQCDASGNGGTAIDEMWLNHIVDSLRNAVRTAGAAQNETAGDMLAEAFGRYASGGIYFKDTGVANAYALSSPLSFVMPKSEFEGKRIRFSPANTNTGPSTVNTGSGLKKILSPTGALLSGSELQAFVEIEAEYKSALDGGAGAYAILPWCYFPATPTLYVRSDGNDSNNGASNDAAHAFATIQGAVNFAAIRFAASRGNTIQIVIGLAGSYSAPGSIPTSLRSLTFIGDANNQDTFVITRSAGSVFGASNGQQISLSGVKLAQASSIDHIISTLNGGSITIDHVTLAYTGTPPNGTTGNLAHICAAGGGILVGPGCKIASGGAVALWATYGGVITLTATLTVVGTPAFALAFAIAFSCGVIFRNDTAAISGSATGVRYLASLNGVMANIGSPTFFPGSIAGSSPSGGQYS